MKITFDIDNKLEFYLNEALSWMKLALTQNNANNYKYLVLFSAFCIEHGLLAAVRDLYGDEKIYEKKSIKNRTIKFAKLVEILENDLDKNITKLFTGLEVWDVQENESKSSVSFDTTILKKIMREGVIERRNELLHSEGEFDTEELMENIKGSLLLLNLILPKRLKFNHSLSVINIEFVLKNDIFWKIMPNVVKEFIVFDERENRSELCEADLIDLHECPECGENSLLILELNTLAYLCQLCLEHGYLVRCIQCDKLILPSQKWDDKGISHICEYCCDNLLR